MSSSATLKRNISKTFRYSQHNNRHESFLNNSSSSSITENEEKIFNDTILKNRLVQCDQRKIRHLPMNNQNNIQNDTSNPMIQELIQSNMNLK